MRFCISLVIDGKFVIAHFSNFKLDKFNIFFFNIFFFNIFVPLFFIYKFIYVSCPHTSDVFADVSMECLLDWNIDYNLSTLTVDNYTTNDAIIEFLSENLSNSSLLLGEEFFHMCYCAHILDLIVKERLDVISNNVERM